MPRNQNFTMFIEIKDDKLFIKSIRIKWNTSMVFIMFYDKNDFRFMI